MNQSVLDSLDVQNITRFDRSEHELEAFLLLSVLVAGKNAKVQQEKLKEFLEPCLQYASGPFDYLWRLCDGEWGLEEPPTLVRAMKQHKLGQYRRLARCFKQIADTIHCDRPLCNLKVHDLEEIYGIGPKTARFFLLHSRPDQQLAVLDTHILSWMKNVKRCKNVPKVTPGSRVKYRMWELRFLYFCQQAKKTPAELDLEIWNQRSKNGNAYVAKRRTDRDPASGGRRNARAQERHA